MIIPSTAINSAKDYIFDLEVPNFIESIKTRSREVFSNLLQVSADVKNKLSKGIEDESFLAEMHRALDYAYFNTDAFQENITIKENSGLKKVLEKLVPDCLGLEKYKVTKVKDAIQDDSSKTLLIKDRQTKLKKLLALEKTTKYSQKSIKVTLQSSNSAGQFFSPTSIFIKQKDDPQLFEELSALFDLA